MKIPRIVIDTNVIVAALRSKRGASFKLLSLIERRKFAFALSVPLFLEYEEVSLRQAIESETSQHAIEAILDRLAFCSENRSIFFLWRPYLPDPKDDMVLELAIGARCEFIVSYNKRHFRNLNKFGVRVFTSKEFLQYIGELP